MTDERLHKLVRDGDLEGARFLLGTEEGKALVKVKDKLQRTPLHLAAFNGNKPMTQALISAGASVHATAADGMTALHFAAMKGQDDTVQLLIQKGGNVNQKMSKGQRSVAHLAAKSGHTSTLKLLAAFGANLSVVNSQKQTPLDLLSCSDKEKEALIEEAKQMATQVRNRKLLAPAEAEGGGEEKEKQMAEGGAAVSSSSASIGPQLPPHLSSSSSSSASIGPQLPPHLAKRPLEESREIPEEEKDGTGQTEESVTKKPRTAAADADADEEMSSAHPRRYRPNVGVVIFNKEGQVLVGERLKPAGAWQLPQGGIADGESPVDAAWREMYEETGLRKGAHAVELVGPVPGDPLTYDFPQEKKGWVGQAQRFFLFFSPDDDLPSKTDVGGKDGEPPEFSRMAWRSFEQVVSGMVSFKKPVYEELQRRTVPAIEAFLKSRDGKNN